ncbi:MAG: DUF4350 domain-containing protein [Pyrinomonadaceae bacterium]
MNLIAILVLLFIPFVPAYGQQMADPEFNASVQNPTYSKNGPRILFDEAHNNFHTTTERYKPFVDLITNDGYRVVRNRQAFSKTTLDSFKVLVIANALGAEEMDDEGADHPAFTEDECEAVRAWVKNGASLLLIADHAPFGAAAENLAKRFGVEMSKGFTFDEKNSVHDFPSFVIYSRENKQLGEHPITEGRTSSERVNRVIAFTGQSLKGPADAAVILKLSESAKDRPQPDSQTEAPAAGRGQALAFKFGSGRVIVLGEAAMLSAQIAGPQKFKFGMNYEGTDNRQFTLNLMHWLSGALRER